jgi:hypothetical protein
MWVDERRTVHTSEPGHWTEVVRLSPPSYAAMRCTPPAQPREVPACPEPRGGDVAPTAYIRPPRDEHDGAEETSSVSTDVTEDGHDG